VDALSETLRDLSIAPAGYRLEQIFRVAEGVMRDVALLVLESKEPGRQHLLKPSIDCGDRLDPLTHVELAEWTAAPADRGQGRNWLHVDEDTIVSE